MALVGHKLSRRLLLGSMVGAAGAVFVAACGGPAPAPTATPAPATKAPAQAEAKPTVAPTAKPAAAGVTEVRISVWGDVTDKQVYDNMTGDFNASQSAVKATGDQFVGGYYDKMQTALAGGTAPDILYFQGWSWQPFADKKVLAPFDEYISSDKFKDPWPDIPNYKDNTIWHGKTYMTTVDTGSIVIFYNKALFDKFGVAYPKDGWSYADFQKTVQTLSKEDGGTKYYGYAQAGGWNGAYARSLHWIRMDGKLEWDQIVEPKKAMFTQPEIVDALQYTICDTISKGFCPSPSAIQGGGVTIATGRVGLTPEGPWFLAQMQGPNPKTPGGIPFDVVDFPLGKTGKNETMAEVHGHCMNQASKSKDAAWQLLKFTVSDKGQQRIAEGGRMCNTPDNITKFWVPIAQKLYNFQNGAAFARGMQYGRNPMFNGAGGNLDAVSQAAGTPLTVAWDAMNGNQRTAKEAMEMANPMVQAILDDYWASQK